MTMKGTVIIVGLGMLSFLAACGTNPQERTTGGAAAGAATGAGIGALAGPPGMVVGALVGGGAGATAGAVTTPQQVNLGKPPWTNPETRVPTPGAGTRVWTPRTNSQEADVDRLNEQSLRAAQTRNP